MIDEKAAVVGFKMLHKTVYEVSWHMFYDCIEAYEAAKTSEQPVDCTLKWFADHLIVKSGRNDATNQYGHLELWWAAKSVHEEASALYNPWMCLGSAENSYALAAMGELQAALSSATQAPKRESSQPVGLSIDDEAFRNAVNDFARRTKGTVWIDDDLWYFLEVYFENSKPKRESGELSKTREALEALHNHMETCYADEYPADIAFMVRMALKI